MRVDQPIAIEVVYGLADEQHVIPLTVANGTTVAEAVRLSGLAVRYPQIESETAAVGIHGRIVSRDAVLQEGDRVEIYRRLVADPKQARRRRALRER
jgi:putative ubiquitin-RnfH superfamily antitoxin RatB of RatAB toxin-antitoxin module